MDFDDLGCNGCFGNLESKTTYFGCFVGRLFLLFLFYPFVEGFIDPGWRNNSRSFNGCLDNLESNATYFLCFFSGWIFPTVLLIYPILCWIHRSWMEQQ